MKKASREPGFACPWPWMVRSEVPDQRSSAGLSATTTANPHNGRSRNASTTSVAALATSDSRPLCATEAAAGPETGSGGEKDAVHRVHTGMAFEHRVRYRVQHVAEAGGRFVLRVEERDHVWRGRRVASVQHLLTPPRPEHRPGSAVVGQ